MSTHHQHSVSPKGAGRVFPPARPAPLPNLEHELDVASVRVI